MLTIALPTGSLQQKTIELFRRSGINIPDPTRRHWVEIGHKLVKTIVWVHPRDIPNSIHEGMVEGGITGSDCYNEWFYSHYPENLDSLRRWACFSYSKRTNYPCQVVFVAAKGESASAPGEGEEVCTEFPNWTERGLLLGLEVKVVAISGSVEARIPHRCRFGVTITETGESLEVNELKVVDVLDSSSPVLLGRNNWSSMQKAELFYELAEKLTSKEGK